MENKRKKLEMNWSVFSKYRSLMMGAAAVLVVLCHMHYVVDVHRRIGKMIIEICNNGSMGVEMFLFLSGIGLYYSFSKKPKLLDFYKKRISNVYIIYLIIALPYVIWRCFFFEHDGILRFFEDWSGARFWNGTMREIWYVPTIIVLYLFYPLIHKVMFCKGGKYAVAITAITTVAWFGLCFGYKQIAPDSYSRLEIAVTRVPSFLIGCCCGKFVFEKKKFGVGAYLLFAVGILLKIVCFFLSDDIFLYRLSTCFLIISLLFIVAVFVQLVNLKPFYKLLSFIGSISLELYLTHNLIKEVFYQLDIKGLWLYIGIVAFSFVISIFLAKLRRLIVKRVCS